MLFRSIQDGITKPHHESKKFIAGMSHAYDRTFDLTGMPKGWNTTSRVYLGVCFSWRLIASHAVPFKWIHQWLKVNFGEREIGDEQRVRKVFSRMGLKFDEDVMEKFCQETVEISAVHSGLLTTPDK